MRKNVFGRHFKRDKNERTALFKGLISALVLHGRIKTTEAKAKAIKGRVDKLVTRAKTGKDAESRFIAPFVSSKVLVKKLIDDIAPRFSKRTGGYTRIIKLGRRMHDSAALVAMEWVEGEQNSELETKEGIEKKKQEKLKTQSAKRKTTTQNAKDTKTTASKTKKEKKKKNE